MIDCALSYNIGRVVDVGAFAEDHPPLTAVKSACTRLLETARGIPGVGDGAATILGEEARLVLLYGLA
jgi:hypothetical protein